MNQNQQAIVIWSSLPDLNLRRQHRSGQSSREYALTTSQLSDWTEFEQEVRQKTVPVFGNPVNFVAPIPAPEHYIVATESGVSARIVQNIFQKVGTVFEVQGLHVKFGDSPAGPDVALNKYPDAIIEDLRIPGVPHVVGEFKTPWNEHLDRMSDDRLARLLGSSILQTVDLNVNANQ